MGEAERQGIKGFERKLRQLRPNINVRDDSLATLRYLSVCVCVLLLGCSPSHTHFSTLFRAGGEKLRKVRIAQRELVVFLCTHCTCAYTSMQSMLYMECCTLCTRNCFILRYTSCPWRCRKGCLIFSPAKLFHFHFRSRSCARLAVIGFQNEIHLMANEALIYAIHVVKACGS